MIHPISRLVLFPLLKNIFNFKHNLPHITKGKNYIFAMNHASGLDVLLAPSVIVPITKRHLSTFLDFEIYDNIVIRPLFSKWKAIRVNRRDPAEKKRAMEQGLKYLQKGHDILIFPEGEIYGGKTNEMCRASTGVIQLALKARKTIIPIGISGSFQAWVFPYPCIYPSNLKNLLKFDFFHPISMRFGKEINLSNYYGIDIDKRSGKNKKLLRNLTTRLMKDISGLAGYPYLYDSDK